MRVPAGLGAQDGNRVVRRPSQSTKKVVARGSRKVNRAVFAGRRALARSRSRAHGRAGSWRGCPCGRCGRTPERRSRRATAGCPAGSVFGARRRRRVAGRAACAGEIEEVRALGLVELKRTGERLEHGVGDAGGVAAFELGVVGDADAGERGDLLASKPGTRRAPPPKVRTPACSGVILARLEVRNSCISRLASTRDGSSSRAALRGTPSSPIAGSVRSVVPVRSWDTRDAAAAVNDPRHPFCFFTDRRHLPCAQQ